MRKILFFNLPSLIALGAVAWGLCTSVAYAEFDPFDVYVNNTEKGCIDDDISSSDAEMNLSALVQIGICRNSLLAADFMAIKSAASAAGATKSAYLPTLSANVGTGYYYNKYKKPFVGMPQEKDYPYMGSLTLSWLLFDFGGRSSRNDMMMEYLNAANANYNAGLHDTVLAINKAYFDLLSAKEVLKANEKTEASYKQSYDETKKRYDIGLTAKSDMLLAKTTYERSKLAIVVTQNNIEKYQAALAALLNLPPETKFNLALPSQDDLAKLAIEDNINKMIATALEVRPELLRALSSGKAAEKNIAATRSDGLPAVALNAATGYEEKWKDSNGYHYNSSIGVNLNFPLFTGFSDTYKIVKAKTDFAQARFNIEAVKDLIKTEVWNAYHDYKTAVSAYEINQTVLASAEENERVSISSYRAGREAILNLLTVQAQLASARQDLAISFYNVLIAKASLYRSIGSI